MDKEQADISGRGNNLSDIFWPIAAVLVTIVVFIPSSNYQFLLEWDDRHYIAGQHLEITLANIRYWLTGAIQKLYTPVTSYSLMIDHYLFGDNPVGYHLHNLLLHCGSVILLMAIMKQLRVSTAIAAATAMLWAVYPQRVPSVVWISERKDVLVVFFALASLYTYVAAAKKSRLSIASPVFLLLSLGAKPAAVGLPVLMLIYTLWHHRKRRELRLLIPPVASAVLYLVWFFYVQNNHAAIPVTAGFLQRTWIISHNIMWYLCSSFVPFQLNPVYPRVTPFSLEYLPLICGFILLLGIFCTMLFVTPGLSRKQKIYLLTSVVLCWGALFFPVSGSVSIGAVDYCDRYNYLPSIVVWTVLAMFISRQIQREWIQRKRLRRYMILAFLPVLGLYWYSNWSYMPVWSSSESLFVRAVQWRYPNPRAIENLGTTAVNRENPQLLELASEKYLALFAAGAGLPWYPEQIQRQVWLHSGLFLGAYAQFLCGNPAEAFPVFVKLQTLAQRKELKFYPDNGYLEKLWGSLAACYLRLKQPGNALKCLENQLGVLEPGSFDALFNKGLTAFIRKDYTSAEKYWQAASMLKPDDKRLIYNLSAVRKIVDEEKPRLR